MSTVVQFHLHHARTFSRAAKRDIASAVKPATRAGSVLSTENHQSSGMLLRCHHLLTCAGVAPSSAAQASRVAQSSMIERNEGNSFKPDMQIGLRQSVLNSKPNVSGDCGKRLGQKVVPMDESASAYRSEFLARVRAARATRFDTQDDIAAVLGLKQSLYSKYEVRSLMPHRLIPRFCKACGITTDWLFTGKGAGPAWSAVSPVDKPQRKRIKRVSRRAA